MQMLVMSDRLLLKLFGRQLNGILQLLYGVLTAFVDSIKLTSQRVIITP